MTNLRKINKNGLKFGALLVCVFFYIQNYFLGIGRVNWTVYEPVTHQINNYIEKLGRSYNTIMWCYFNEFQARMYGRYQIPPHIVEKYKKYLFYSEHTHV